MAVLKIHSSHYYATQPEGVGITVWKFQTEGERDAWVMQRVTRQAITASHADRLIYKPTPGLYVRWGKPEFAHQ